MPHVVSIDKTGVKTYHWYDSICSYVGINKEKFLEHPDVQKAMLAGARLYKCSIHNCYVVGSVRFGCLQYDGCSKTDSPCTLEVGPVN